MADPLSFAASVAGIISLGLVVTRGLTEYYGRWASQDEEISHLVRRIQDLQSILEVLEEPVEKLSSQHAAARSQVEKCVRSCDDNIKKLEATLDKCKQHAPPSSLREQLRELRRKASFPFRKDTLDQTRSHLDDVQGSLDLALQALQIKLLCTDSQQNHAFQSDMKASMASQTQVITLMQTKLDMFLAQTQQGTRIKELESQCGTLQRQLMEKPSLQRAACDELQQLTGMSDRADLMSPRPPGQSALSVKGTNSLMRCTCRPSKRSSRPRLPIPTSSFCLESTCHSQGCPLFWTAKKTHTLSLTLRVWGILLSQTVQATFSGTHPAGGCKLEMGLTFRAIVPKDAPAFRRVWRNIGNGNKHFSADVVLQEIKQLFSEGKASPTDVNANGWNLLHSLAGAYIWRLVDDGNMNTMLRLFSGLAELGVPINDVESDFSETPLDILLKSGIYYHRLLLAFKVGELGWEIRSTDCQFGSGSRRSLDEYISRYQQLKQFAEAAGLGSLYSAVCRRSADEVRQILAERPSSILERDRQGNTPLHYSANWHAGIKILLESNGGRDLVHVPDHRGVLPICHAFEARDIAVAEILLQAGSGCTCVSRSCEAFERYLSELPEYWIRQTLVPALLNRRQRLVQLASRYLPKTAYDALQVPVDRVLDHKASATLAALRDHEIDVPLALNCPPHGVYHCERLNPTICDIFYTNGFLDINARDAHGNTPLVTAFYRRWDWSSSFRQSALDLIMWFFAKDADISGFSVAHAVAACLPGLLDTDTDFRRSIKRKWTISRRNLITANLRYGPKFQELVVSLFSSASSDHCVCSCSRRGCTPFLRCMHGFPRLYASDLESASPTAHPQRQMMVEWVQESTELPGSILESITRQFIRHETFSKLELTHICCARERVDPRYPPGPPPAEFVADIRHIEHAQLELLEVLVEEFEAEFERLGQPLAEFMEGYWNTRMEEVLEVSESDVEEQVRRIEEIGVVLER